MPESAITPEVGFRAQARRKGIACGIWVRLPGGFGPPWSWRSEVDLADPDAAQALLVDLAEADEQRRLASGLAGLPPLDLEAVRNEIEGRRALELEAVLSVDVTGPNCRPAGQVWADVAFRSRRVRRPAPIYQHRTDVTDDVAVESLVLTA